MPDELDGRALGRMEEQLAGLRRDQQQTREKVGKLFDAVEGLRTDISEKVTIPLQVHETRIAAIERRLDGMWGKVIGIVTLVVGAVTWVIGLLRDH